MAFVLRAVDLGYRNTNAFRILDALDPIRNRADFRLLMMDLSFPAGPFDHGD